MHVFVNAEGIGLRRQSSDSTRAGDVLLRRAEKLTPLDYSSDGNYLVFHPEELRPGRDPSGSFGEGDDLWVLPLDGADKQPRRITNTPAIRETTARLSPDVRWIAYTAEENGRPDIWVQEFPSGAAPRRITTSGGRDPSWRKDGKELYYVTRDGKRRDADGGARRDRRSLHVWHALGVVQVRSRKYQRAPPSLFSHA